jgi:hypothetical protein
LRCARERLARTRCSALFPATHSRCRRVLSSFREYEPASFNKHALCLFDAAATPRPASFSGIRARGSNSTRFAFVGRGIRVSTALCTARRQPFSLFSALSNSSTARGPLEGGHDAQQRHRDVQRHEEQLAEHEQEAPPVRARAIPTERESGDRGEGFYAGGGSGGLPPTNSERQRRGEEQRAPPQWLQGGFGGSPHDNLLACPIRPQKRTSFVLASLAPPPASSLARFRRRRAPSSCRSEPTTPLCQLRPRRTTRLRISTATSQFLLAGYQHAAPPPTAPPNPPDPPGTSSCRT